jgi:hypothetical protein
MPIGKITGQGLSAIAFSVALLWTCLVGERVTWRNANAQRIRALREIEQLRQRFRRPTPVSAPAPRQAVRSAVTVG